MYTNAYDYYFDIEDYNECDYVKVIANNPNHAERRKVREDKKGKFVVVNRVRHYFKDMKRCVDVN